MRSQKNALRLQRRRPPLKGDLPKELRSNLEFDLYNSERECQVRVGWLFPEPLEEESTNWRNIKLPNENESEENDENVSVSSVSDSTEDENRPKRRQENYIAARNHRCVECRAKEKEIFSHNPIGQVF